LVSVYQQREVPATPFFDHSIVECFYPVSQSET
jgi:hypothetical protein